MGANTKYGLAKQIQDARETMKSWPEWMKAADRPANPQSKSDNGALASRRPSSSRAPAKASR
jgi:hypothetical protein